MPIDRKALKQRMKEEKGRQGREAKQITFPLPDLRGPAGNAFALLGQAEALMKRANLPKTAYVEFHKEATNGDYDHLLKTIQGWFTVAVQNTEFIPVGDGFDLSTLARNPDDLTWDDVDPNEEASPELTKALEDFAATAEHDRRIADIQDRINKEIRAELGLSDDEVVIVQIKRTKGK